MKILQIILAILLPPVAVLTQTGFSMQFLLNIVLTLLAWLPGVVHAFWVITAEPTPQAV